MDNKLLRVATLAALIVVHIQQTTKDVQQLTKTVYAIWQKSLSGRIYETKAYD